ncbi:MAG: DNA-3-methyladenine glycosylase [Pseudomonadota bacterium]|nr:DNA-3-methyladenine glycosylase [Pseudomonadota bacterium]
MRLCQDFFSQKTTTVARSLLGCTLVWKNQEAVITETEAYAGEDDPACHAACGLTPRNQIMYGPCGFTYVYLIYGMYHCLNIVTESKGYPAAVLIRGLDVNNVIENGPGKLCRRLSISKNHNGINLCRDKSHGIYDNSLKDLKIITTPRIGIKKGLEKPWRYVLKKYAKKSDLEFINKQLSE